MSFEFEQRITKIPSGLIIKYYTIEDIKIPWYDFWSKKYEILNNKNMRLWNYSKEISKELDVESPYPPIKWTY